MKIRDLANRLIHMSGLRPGIDIEIRVTGSRPGEKLHEKLWSDASQVTPTVFPRVLSAQPPPPPQGFADLLRSLEQAALTRDDELTRETLMSMPINFGIAPSPGKQDQPWHLVQPIRDSKLDADSLASRAATA